MDLESQPNRIRAFYLRTAQIIRKICRNKTTLKTEIQRTSNPNRYYPLLHKVMLNYPLLTELAEKLCVSRDVSLGAVLVHEILSGNLENTELKSKLVEMLGSRTLKIPRIRTFFRINTLKMKEEELAGYDVARTCIPFVYKVTKSEPEKDLKLIFDDQEMVEKITFQSLPSCLPALLLNPPEGATVIDATAAPGNKTTHLSSIMNGTGCIYAFDRDKKRVEILERNIEKYGASNVKIVHGDFLRALPEKYPAEYILVDPSCSGSGIHLNYKKNDERIKALHNFQSMILNHALSFSPLRVVYSTCSYHQEEGEDVIKEVLEKHPEYEVEPVGDFWTERGHPGYEFSEMVARSGNEDGDKGFFVAVLRKKD